MKNFTLQEELEDWVIEEKGEGEFKDFTFWADETKGSFDSEKGAMYDYKIYAKNNLTGEKYVGEGGYYTNQGHYFSYPVEFTLQVKKEKKTKSEFIPVKVMKDDSSHNYIVPQDLWDDWEGLTLAMDSTEEGSDEYYSLMDDFIAKFSKYATGGCVNNYQLFISQDELKRLIC